MSNNPFDFEADRLADKYRDIDQDAGRLETLTDHNIGLRVLVHPCHLEDEEMIVGTDIEMILDTGNPLQSFSDQLTALSKKALAMLEADKKRELERKERTP